MTTPGITTPYSTLSGLFPKTMPQWLDPYDAQRLLSYQLYDDIYWGNPDAFKLMQRGTDGKPIYIPSGRVICNTMNRYTGRNPRLTFDPAAGSANDQAAAMVALTQLFTRERFLASYNAAKRFGVVRGDWVLHVTANPDKPQGSRITVRYIDPGMYFPITDDNDVDRILGIDLVENVLDGDKNVIVRQRYLKSIHPDRGGVEGGPITYQKDVFEVDGWNTPTAKKVSSKTFIALPQVELPVQITAIPVYHIKNFETPQDPFGASEMRGLERIIAGINQAISDEDLSLALAGIGIYVTDAGAPVNDAGEEIPWQLGPGRVIEMGSGKTFTRVEGVRTIAPFQDHLGYLHDQLGRVSGASDVAQGVVDVTVAESGVALALRMGPILTEAEDKAVTIKSVHDQFVYDLLTGWLPAYEQLNFPDVQPSWAFGDPLPLDKKARFDQLIQMYSNNLISAQYFRDAVKEIGYEIPADMGQQITDEQTALADIVNGGPSGDPGADPNAVTDPAANNAPA